jgi:hypothetical protein
MTCTKTEIKNWTVYDARYKQFYYLTNEEFKNFLLDKPVKLIGKYIFMDGKEGIWVDAVLNSDWLI